MQFTVPGRDPGRPEPSIPTHHFTAFYDLDTSPEQIIDRMDYDLSCLKFLGDAFPTIFPNFGPGVMAAFLGCELETSVESYTCWFHTKHQLDISDLNFAYNQDNPWLHRIKSIAEAGMKRWQGQVQIAMTDLGGNLDVLSSFRPGESLLYDLYDYPDDVKRLTWQVHDLWWQYFDEIDSIIRPTSHGYTAWASLFSTVPYYMLQCDFCYMISPDMFDEFVRPELAATCKRLGNAFYHLDGPGELPHLDSLLSIPELKGIQWIPGAGAPDWKHWPDLYRKIMDAGKLLQIYGDVETIHTVMSQLGSGRGIAFLCYGGTEDEALDCINRYGK